jgi:hypothetical protein
MASGILGTPTDLSAGSYATVYTVPASTFAVASISIVNRSNTTLTVRLAVTTQVSGTPTNAEFIEYDSSIAPKGILERTGMVLEAGRKLVVYSSAVNCNAVVFGIETAT